MNCEIIGTKEQYDEFSASLAEIKASGGSIIMALQKAQDIYKYIPRDTIVEIASHLNSTPAEVYGIATFYSQFKLNPSGKYKLSVCMGTACYVKGAGDVLDKIKELLKISEGETTPDGLFSIEASRCIGCCGLAPVLAVNEEIHGRLHVEEVEDVLKKYKSTLTV